jgi:hypothetical protein
MRVSERIGLAVLWILAAFCLVMSWSVDSSRGLAIALGFAGVTAALLLVWHSRQSRSGSRRRDRKGWALVVAAALSVVVPGELIFNQFGTPILGAFVGFGITAPWLLASRTTRG